MPEAIHPGNERLSAYLLGMVRSPELEQIENHLSSCPRCRADFARLEEPADSFVSCLRGAAAVAPVPGLARVVEAAARLPGRTVPGQVGPLPTVAGRELIRELGRGGLGVVYLVRHPGLDALQAVKRPLGDDRRLMEDVLARFRREVRAVGQLRHDHIVRALDAGSDGEGPYLVLEYLDGLPLNKILDREDQLAPDVACEVVRQAALGLQHAHEKGLVHRDVKPGNLMLARVDTLVARVVIIDWGLAKTGGEKVPDDAYTSIGTAMGTPDYIAPEQARDAHGVDIRADVYSLGVTLYTLLAGKPPFAGVAKMEKLVAHQSRPLPPLGRLDVSPALLAVLAKMTEKDPARRFATPAEVAWALAPLCPDRPCLAALLGDLMAVPERPTRRRFLIAAGATVGGMTIAGAVWWGMQRRPAPGGGKAAPSGPVRMKEDHLGHCSSIAFTPDGLRAASEDGGRDVVIWDLRNQCTELRWDEWTAPKVFPDASGILAISPDGSRLASGGLTALKAIPSLRVWGFDGKPLKQDFAGRTPEYARGLAFSPDNGCLAMVEVFGRVDFLGFTGTSKVVVYDIKPFRRYELPARTPVSCLAFSPDGQTLAAGDGPVLRLWDWRNRTPRDLPGHKEAIDAVAYAADGRIFTASLSDRTMRVWKEGKGTVVVADAGEVLESVSISASAERAVVGSRSGALAVWDLTNGKEVYRHKHESAVTAVAVSADGRQALAALKDRSVWLHPLPAG